MASVKKSSCIGSFAGRAAVMCPDPSHTGLLAGGFVVSRCSNSNDDDDDDISNIDDDDDDDDDDNNNEMIIINNDNNNNNIQRRDWRFFFFFFTISSLRRELSPARTLKWPGRKFDQQLLS